MKGSPATTARLTMTGLLATSFALSWLVLAANPTVAADPPVTPANVDPNINLPNPDVGLQPVSGNTVKPLEPIKPPPLSIDIPTVNFSDLYISEDAEGQITAQIPWLAQYLSGAYKYAVGLGAFLAAVMLIIGGFMYLTAGDSGRTAKGKEMISDALLGLAVMLGSYVLLNLVNPSLTTLDAVKVPLLKRVQFTAAEQEDLADANSPASGDTICKSPAECTKWCNEHPDPQTWPKSSAATADPASLVKIPSSTGLQVDARSDAAKATAQTAAALKRAGEIAVQKKSSYKIRLVSASRTLQTQIQLACNKVKEGKASDLGRLVAYPGGSNHGKGIAVDVWLEDGNRTLTVVGNSSKQKDPQWGPGSKILDEIMTQAGFKRYNAEIWHFEFGGPSGSRCIFPNCPFPPK
jgi:hypothetical protein